MDDLLAALGQHFGFPRFRGLQETVIRHVLDRQSALVVMATGEGKSLCYQLPALVSSGVTLVVSPLIALMEDQVAALRRRGLPAACIHSQVSRVEREARLRSAQQGNLKLLYVTPERFRVGAFLDEVKGLTIPLLAVDEAHCVSQWGHDFRPDYGRLGLVREALGMPPCLALTATATPTVQSDIRTALRMPDAPLFHTGIERDNLCLTVRECDGDEAKLARLLETLDLVGGPAIVYFALIRDLLRVEGELLRRGMRPLVYHGDLSASERRELQARFQDSKDAVILATNAFGMGVDKPDIRLITHYQIPRTLEAYYQEIGRAGRDGRASWCELLYFEEDLSIQREFTEWANPDVTFVTQVVQHLEGLGARAHALDVQGLRETLLVKNRRDGRIETCLRLLQAAGCTRGDLGRDFEWLRTPSPEEIRQWLPEGKRQRDLTGLLEMVRYARQPECRKRWIHRYFGFDDFAAGCGACDADTDVTAWLASRLPVSERRPIAVAVLEPTSAQLARGDWIQVRGLGLCHVTRVHREGKRLRADVELADDLSTRSLDLRKTQWRRVEH